MIPFQIIRNEGIGKREEGGIELSAALRLNRERYGVLRPAPDGIINKEMPRINPVELVGPIQLVGQVDYPKPAAGFPFEPDKAWTRAPGADLKKIDGISHIRSEVDGGDFIIVIEPVHIDKMDIDEFEAIIGMGIEAEFGPVIAAVDNQPARTHAGIDTFPVMFESNNFLPDMLMILFHCKSNANFMQTNPQKIIFFKLLIYRFIETICAFTKTSLERIRAINAAAP